MTLKLRHVLTTSKKTSLADESGKRPSLALNIRVLQGTARSAMKTVGSATLPRRPSPSTTKMYKLARISNFTSSCSINTHSMESRRAINSLGVYRSLPRTVRRPHLAPSLAERRHSRVFSSQSFWVHRMQLHVASSVRSNSIYVGQCSQSSGLLRAQRPENQGLTPGRSRGRCLLRSTQIGFEANTASYPVYTGGSRPYRHPTGPTLTVPPSVMPDCSIEK